MPNVPQYNLPKFKSMPLTKEERYQARYWRYKKSTPPEAVHKASKVRKTKLVDKTIISEDIARQNHVSSIKNEL